MTHSEYPVLIGEMPQQYTEEAVHGEYVPLLGETFYRIRNYDAMEPFFMSIVSSSDHWLFIASTGGLSAGRVNAERAIFPYYTEDKLTENAENTGSKTILRVRHGDRVRLWEPFSERQAGIYRIERCLYKNVTGTALVFEENNHSLGLIYRYAWRTSEQYGFVRTTWLTNAGETACQVEILDGVQNLLPANATVGVQATMSCLLDAYKRAELDSVSGLGIFALNATLTDLPEPSESLLATTVAQVGLKPSTYLLSTLQTGHFRAGKRIQTETEIRGRRGAYFVQAAFDLAPQSEQTWHMLIDGQQDASAVARKAALLRGDSAALQQAIEADIAAGQRNLWRLVAAGDGVQLSGSALYSASHFASVMFNLMRGGIPADQYWIQRQDFVDFIGVRNRPVLEAHAAFFAGLPARIHLADLLARAQASASADLIRLSHSFLPLTFSRRHGDPSRPWNRFAINIRKPDGSLKLDYEGNWRDIFQNWEALAYSYPEYVESMIATFLNATTPDGYNPYRITHAGIDWELAEPDNPWANIGYWSDHQIIYLLKLMEISAQAHPGKLRDFLAQAAFSYANVPYRIKRYAEILDDPYNTIEFDWATERQVEHRQQGRGTDGRLVMDTQGQVLHASLAEKLLTLLLAKLDNFVPEGGIWMNTQRPEWNDANNALVGKGLSVVTLGYLRRYLAFCRALFAESGLESVPVRAEVAHHLARIAGILREFQPALAGTFSDEQRRRMMDRLGQAGSDYRWGVYEHGFAGQIETVAVAEIVIFFDQAQTFIEHALRANRRPDALYHAYNVLHLGEGRATIGYLYEMLEGQAAILTSGMLSAEESIALLHSLRHGPLYRADQHTYILYPDRVLPGFLERNSVPPAPAAEIGLFAALADAGDSTLVTRDPNGVFHFGGTIRHVKDVRRALEALKARPEFAAHVEADSARIEVLFETMFRHSEFTGRSGTFFAYEGLGSVYWHMVAKLLLAVQETALRFRHDPQAVQALSAIYADIRLGLGFNKPPDVYGAFPTDPYSHTPKGQGARQPGMTGLVKEVILTRQAELGWFVENGGLVFDGVLVDPQSYLQSPAEFEYLDVNRQPQIIPLKVGEQAFTLCQTPVVLCQGSQAGITLYFADGRQQAFDGLTLDEVTSRPIFLRDGHVRMLKVTFPPR